MQLTHPGICAHSQSRLARTIRTVVLGALGLALPAPAATLYINTSANQLLSLDSATPGVILNSATITGLQLGETIAGIDFRPANGLLYGLGSASRLYTINPMTGTASFVATLSIPLAGNTFGVDFNPVADRLRVVSNTGQDLRINPADGVAIADGTLAYMAGDPNAGQTPGVVHAAYTNSFAGAATTTLYDIDASRGVLAIQNPPNNGTLMTVGSLGINIGPNGGFDILSNNSAAFAALQPATGGPSSLYSLNLSNGSVTSLGLIGSGVVATGLAAAPVPEPGSMVLGSLGVLFVAAMRRRLRC